MAEDWLARLSPDVLDEIARQRQRSPAAKKVHSATVQKAHASGKKAAAPKKAIVTAKKAAAPRTSKAAKKATGRTASGTRRVATRMAASGTHRHAIPISNHHDEILGITHDMAGSGRASRDLPRIASNRSFGFKVRTEFREFMCGDSKKYAALRKRLDDLVTHNTSSIVVIISGVLAVHVGVAAAVVAPLVSALLAAVLKIGLSAYCAT